MYSLEEIIARNQRAVECGLITTGYRVVRLSDGEVIASGKGIPVYTGTDEVRIERTEGG